MHLPEPEIIETMDASRQECTGLQERPHSEQDLDKDLDNNHLGAVWDRKNNELLDELGASETLIPEGPEDCGRDDRQCQGTSGPIKPLEIANARRVFSSVASLPRRLRPGIQRRARIGGRIRRDMQDPP